MPRARLRATLLLLALTLPCVYADSLHDEIQRANGLLRSGDAQAAIDRYHQLQVDYPDSPILDYNIGCAQYELGMKALGAQDEKTGTSALSQARESFDRALQSPDENVRKSAAFNRANTLAQTAKVEGASIPAEQRVKTFHDAMRAYEDVLKTDPENAGAKQNIDHLRYMLKQAMQEPPPQQGAGEENPQEQNQQQNSNDQNQPQSTPQQQDQEQQTDSSQNQEQEQQESQENQPQEQQNEGDNSANEAASDSATSNEEPKDQESEGTPPPEGNTLEALLDSLDEMDKKVQQEIRKSPQSTRFREKAWW